MPSVDDVLGKPSVDELLGAPPGPQPADPPLGLLRRLMQSGEKKSDEDKTLPENLRGFADTYLTPDPARPPINTAGDFLKAAGSDVLDVGKMLTGPMVKGVADLLDYSRGKLRPGDDMSDDAKSALAFFANEGSVVPLKRMAPTPGAGVVEQNIGGKARGEDFSNAATSMAGPAPPPRVAQKLLALYDEKGIHPAEVAHDAASDVTITQRLLSDSDELPSQYAAPNVSQETLALPAPIPSPWEMLVADIADKNVKPNAAAVAEHYGISEDEARQKLDELSRRPDSPIEIAAGKYSDDPTAVRWRIKNADRREAVLREHDEWAYEQFNLSRRDFSSDSAFVDAVKERMDAAEKVQLAPVHEAGKKLGYTLSDAEAREAAFREKTGVPLDEAIHDVIERSAMAHEDRLAAKAEQGQDVPDEFQRRNPAGRELAPVPGAEPRQQVGPATGTDLDRSAGSNAARGKSARGPQGEITEAGGGVGGKPPAPPKGGASGSIDDARERILKKIDIGGADPSRKWSWSRLYTAVFDKLHPLSEAVEAAGGKDLATAQNPYELARLLSGVAGKADHFLNYGTFDFKTYQNTGPSLKTILAPVGKDLDGFRAFAASLRALELEQRGIKSGFDIDAARQVATDGLPKYGETMAGIIDYQNKVAGYLKESGVLSDKAYAAILEANKLYIPFNRIMDEGGVGGKFGKGSLQARNPVKKIVGSDRDIVDPLESIIRNTYVFTQMAEKNAVGTALVDMLKRANEGMVYERPLMPMGEQAAKAEPLALPKPETSPIERLPEIANRPTDEAIGDYLKSHGVEAPEDLIAVIRTAALPPAGDEIAIFRDGQRETYRVDPDLARAVKGLDVPAIGMLERLLSIPARILRAGAVLTPDFQLRHTFRDYIYAAVTSKGVFTPVDMARGLAGLITHDADYQAWIKGGGGNISMVSLDRRYLQQNLEKLTGETGLMTRAWNVVTSPIRGLQMMTEMAENMSHLGAFKKAMREAGETSADAGKQAIQEAAFTSRDTAVDASRMGASTRAYNMITAFANITLQDTDRIVRAFAKDPVSTAAKVGGAIMLPSALLWYANHDDPRYAEIPQWEKDLFWIGMTENHIWRIPKPFGAGVLFGSGTERMLQAFFDENPEAFKDFAKSIKDTMVPQFFPTAAAPIIDQFANRSTFTNRTLIPGSMEKFLPEYQYTPYTTETTKALGQIIGAFPGIRDWKIDPDAPIGGGVSRALSSPILLENYIRGWSGTLGVYALNLADAALRKADILPDPVKPTATLADIPIIKAFVVRYPTATTQSIQDFEDKYAKNKSYYDTWMAMAKDGNADAMAKIQEAGGPQMFVQLDAIKSVLSEHSQLIRDIYKNPTATAEEKRQLIDQLYYSMIEIGKAGKSMLGQIDRELATVH